MTSNEQEELAALVETAMQPNPPLMDVHPVRVARRVANAIYEAGWRKQEGAKTSDAPG